MAKLPAFRRRGPEVDGALAMALKSMRANPGEDRVQSGMSPIITMHPIIIIKISRSYPRSVISTILPRAHPSTAPVLIPLPFNH